MLFQRQPEGGAAKQGKAADRATKAQVRKLDTFN